MNELKNIGLNALSSSVGSILPGLGDKITDKLLRFGDYLGVYDYP